MAIHVMFDLETLGLDVDACIIQVAFCSCAGGYSSLVAPTTGSRSQSTLQWWADTNPSLFEELTKGKRDLTIVLQEMAAALPKGDDVYVWSKGVDFDVKMLAYWYSQLGLQLPWNYRNQMCYRTLTSLHPDVPFYPPHTAHDALQDATAQYEHLLNILSKNYPWML